MAKIKPDKPNIKNEIIGVLLIALALLFGWAVYTNNAALCAVWVRTGVFGMFGVMGYALPVIVFLFGIFAIRAHKWRMGPGRVIFIVVGIFALFSLIHICMLSDSVFADDFFAYLQACFQEGVTYRTACGVFGGLVSYPMFLLLGRVGSLILFGEMCIRDRNLSWIRARCAPNWMDCPLTPRRCLSG